MPEEQPGDEVARFKAPEIQHNSTGWGPCDMPDQFKDMPYQPFSKADRLGKVIFHILLEFIRRLLCVSEDTEMVFCFFTHVRDSSSCYCFDVYFCPHNLTSPHMPLGTPNTFCLCLNHVLSVLSFSPEKYTYLRYQI